MWMEKGRSLVATLIHAQEFESVIMGESEIVEISKIPSLLFLPGFLMVTMFLWLWKFSPKTPQLMKASEPEFWMFSIALSLLTTFVYPWISSLFGERRDFLEAYGFKDIVWIWFFALASGFFIWLITALSISAVKMRKRLAWAKTTFNEKDSQADLLRKLVRNDLGLVRERGTVENQTFFKLMAADTQSVIWVAPAIQVIWKEDLPLDDPVSKEFMQLLSQPNDSDSIEKLADLIENIRDKAEVRWEDRSGIKRVAAEIWMADKDGEGKPIRGTIVKES
jgi:hypothetical protein